MFDRETGRDRWDRAGSPSNASAKRLARKLRWVRFLNGLSYAKSGERTCARSQDRMTVAETKRGPRVDVLGVEVSPIDVPTALEAFEKWISSREPRYVCVSGVHGIMESRRAPDLREIHNRAGLVTPDGMPLVWLCRRAGFPATQRVYGPDLLLAACEWSLATGARHFFYGGAQGVPELLATRLQERYPGLAVAGTFSPPFRPLTREEDRAVIDRINAARADIVWVGLGTPKQERWMAAHVGLVTAPVLVGVGAAFDFHAGLMRQAPHWMRRTGLEWLFRAMQEPRRLGLRYLRNNPAFLAHLLFSRRPTDTRTW